MERRRRSDSKGKKKKNGSIIQTEKSPKPALRNDNLHRLVADQQIGRFGFLSRQNNQTHRLRRECRELLIPSLSAENILGNSTEQAAGCLFCMRFSEDGSLLATTNADTVHIWESNTGALLYSLKEHQEIVTSVAWFHDTTPSSPPAFYTCSLDKTIRLWMNFKPITVYTQHQDWIRCISLTSQNDTLISGCVSSSIYGWDVQTGQSIFCIPSAHSTQTCPDLNTINSLQFFHSDPNLFISGARDGIIKLWDRRTLKNAHQAVYQFEAHAAKVNTSCISEDDVFILTSGRDSRLRLWDIRSLGTGQVNGSTKVGLVCEYDKHKCTGYNISCAFLNYEQNIVTGSETSEIVIYDRNTAEVVSRLSGHPSVVHLVSSVYSEPTKFVSSSIENPAIILWSPSNAKRISPKAQPECQRSFLTPLQLPADSEEESFLSHHRAAIESLMKKYGDQILKIFHDHNFTFSSNVDWQDLLNRVGTDNKSADLLQMVNDMASDFARALEFYHAANQGTDVDPLAEDANGGEHEAEDDEDDDDDDEDYNEENEGGDDGEAEDGELISLQTLQTALYARQAQRERMFEMRQRQRMEQQQQQTQQGTTQQTSTQMQHQQLHNNGDDNTTRNGA